jgi:5-methylcytosine-specific restriction protein B
MKPPNTGPQAVDHAVAALSAVVGALDPDAQAVLDLVLSRQNVVVYGPPGTGKTRLSFAIRDRWIQTNGANSVWPITFHPSYAYEDFVIGFRPRREDPATFGLQLGPLLLAADHATRLMHAAAGGAPAKVLLVIDEINRADVARVFGELITYIESDKRGEPFRLAQLPDQEIAIPQNLFVLGTMNTADKSVSLLDVALRRRFAFYELPPKPGAFASNPSWETAVGGVAMAQLLDGINARLRIEGVEADRAVGHAILGVATGSGVAGLRERLHRDVHPLVEEYCYLDRGRIKAVLGDLVNDDGRFLDLDDAALVAACAAIVAQPAEDTGAAEEAAAGDDDGGEDEPDDEEA